MPITTPTPPPSTGGGGGSTQTYPAPPNQGPTFAPFTGWAGGLDAFLRPLEAASYLKSTTQALTENVWTSVVFETLRYNDGVMQASASFSSFTIPTRYSDHDIAIIGFLEFAQNSSGTRIVRILEVNAANSTTIHPLGTAPGTVGDNTGVAFSYTLFVGNSTARVTGLRIEAAQKGVELGLGLLGGTLSAFQVR